MTPESRLIGSVLGSLWWGAEEEEEEEPPVLPEVELFRVLELPFPPVSVVEVEPEPPETLLVEVDNISEPPPFLPLPLLPLYRHRQ